MVRFAALLMLASVAQPPVAYRVHTEVVSKPGVGTITDFIYDDGPNKGYMCAMVVEAQHGDFWVWIPAKTPVPPGGNVPLVDYSSWLNIYLDTQPYCNLFGF